MPSTNNPPVEQVAALAAKHLATLEQHKDFDRLRHATTMYVDCWATYTGYPVIRKWDLDADKDNLFKEAMRVLALKAAVWDLTGGDEDAAELLVSLPVDEMVHAVLAQTNLMFQMVGDTGVRFVHMTDTEEFGWEPGDYTAQCYVAAWGEEPPNRYWIGAEETRRRLGMLEVRHEMAGIQRNGRRHEFDFAVA